jgi:hypothetical protein
MAGTPVSGRGEEVKRGKGKGQNAEHRTQNAGEKQKLILSWILDFLSAEAVRKALAKVDGLWTEISWRRTKFPPLDLRDSME